MSETPNPSEVLFPLGHEYTLENGRTVEIHKWSIETMVRVSQRIPRAMEKFLAVKAEEAAGNPIFTMLPLMVDEVKLVIAETIGWTPEQIDAGMTADDVLGVTLAVWDHCLAGPLSKMLGLTNRLNRVGAQPAKPQTTIAPSSKL